MSGAIRRFSRHYFEMVAAMLVGMVVLGGASGLVLNLPDRTSVELVEMAVWMTLPMVAWMRSVGIAGGHAARWPLPCSSRPLWRWPCSGPGRSPTAMRS